MATLDTWISQCCVSENLSCPCLSAMAVGAEALEAAEPHKQDAEAVTATPACQQDD